MALGNLAQSGPDSVDVVVVLEVLEECGDFESGFIGEGWELFWDEAELAGDDVPAILAEPVCDGGGLCAWGDEAGPAGVCGDVVVLAAGEGLDVIGSSFYGGFFAIGCGVGMPGFDEADVVEEKFVAAQSTELAFFEELANFWGGAVVVVGEDFYDDWDFMGCVAFEDDVLHGEFIFAEAGYFFDGAFDDISGDAFFACFFDGCGEAGVGVGIGSGHSGGNHDFFDDFPGGLRFFQRGDCAFRVEPLTSHEGSLGVLGGGINQGEGRILGGGWWRGWWEERS